MYDRRKADEKYRKTHHAQMNRAVMKSHCKKFIREAATENELCEITKIIEETVEKLKENENDQV
jgi:hypothetical protein